MYMLSTWQFTVDGLQHEEGLLEFNRVYRGLGHTRFYLEDELNLLSVNQPAMRYFENFLVSLNIPKTSRDTVRLRMLDYIDSDQLVLPGGAERSSYSEPDTPADGLMASPAEVSRVLDFHEHVPAAVWSKFRHLLTTRLTPGPDINQAPPELLRHIFDLDDYQFLELTEALESRHISLALDLARVTNEPALADWVQLRSGPSRYVRITSWQEQDSRALISGISLTPKRDDYPWQQDYYFTTRLADSMSGTAAPAQTALFPSSGDASDR